MAVNDDLREGKKLLEELNTLRRKMNKEPLRLSDDETLRQFKDLPKDIETARRELADLEGTATNLYETLKGVTSEIKGQLTPISEIRQAFRSLTKDAQKLKYDEQEINQLSIKELQNLQKRAKQNVDILKTSTERFTASEKFNGTEVQALLKRVKNMELVGKSQEEINEYASLQLKTIQGLSEEEKAILANYIDQGKQAEALLKIAEGRLNLEKEVNKNTRGFAALAGLASAIPGLSKLAGPFKEAEKVAKDTFRSTQDSTKSNAAGVKELATAFKAPLFQLGLLASLFKGVLNIAFQLDGQITEVAKSQGKSYAEASAFRAELQDAADASGNIVQTTKSLLEAQQQLSKVAGVTAGFKVKELQDQVRLTKNVGLQAEDAAKLATLQRVNGQTADDTLDSIIGQTTALKLATGVTLDNRDVLKEVANISGQLAANYKNNPILLGEAVVKARSLGLTMGQTAGMASGLLQFESSISAELEAELLTGKELNLEKARMLALQGKSVEAAEELAKQFGSLEDFQNMNVLAQNALAKSMNMTADELANNLLQQENLNNLGKVELDRIQKKREELLKLGKFAEADALLSQARNDEEAKAALDRLSAQEKFTAAVEKAKDLFVGLIDNMPTLLGILGTIAGVMASIAISAVIASGGTAAIGGAIGLAALGIGGGIAGAAIGRSLEGPETKPNGEIIQDGIITPTGGLEVKGPKGSIYLDKDDSVIAGTALNRNNNTNGNSNADTVLNKILKAIEAGGDVYLDANKVGQALSLGIYKSS